MRVLLLPIAAALVAAPSANPPASMSEARGCADTITQVRDATGQPRLDRSPAAPGQGYLIAAVDKRVDGCAVMQMHRDVNDLRPLPKPAEKPVRLQPAH